MQQFISMTTDNASNTTTLIAELIQLILEMYPNMSLEAGECTIRCMAHLSVIALPDGLKNEKTLTNASFHPNASSMTKEEAEDIGNQAQGNQALLTEEELEEEVRKIDLTSSIQKVDLLLNSYT